MNVLIVKVSSIGDVIHTLPSAFYIKKVLPGSKISWVVQEKAASLLVGQNFLEKVYVLPDSFLKPKNWSKTYLVIKDLRKTKWDLIVDFQGLFKTSFLISFLNVRKIGFDRKNSREFISSFFTHEQVEPKYKNIIQKNLSLASFATSKNFCPSILSLSKTFHLDVHQEKRQEVDSWIQKNNLKDFLVISPNTTWESKRWPTENWCELIKYHHGHTAVVVLGVGFGGQAKEIAEYAQKNNPSIHLAGSALRMNGEIKIAPKWDLLTVSYFLKKAKLLIAPDTGILHLADFVGVRSIGIFGPTLVSKHGPFINSENMKNAIQVKCAHKYQKSHGSENCMKSLKADELIKIISRVIST